MTRMNPVNVAKLNMWVLHSQAMLEHMKVVNEDCRNRGEPVFYGGDQYAAIARRLERLSEMLDQEADIPPITRQEMREARDARAGAV